MMARDAKIEVAAINLRISKTESRDYSLLIQSIFGLRRGVRVFGQSYVAISSFDAKTKIGILTKYTEIDIDGQWFNIDDFDTATPEQVKKVNIPKNLKPNSSQFYFVLDIDQHVVAFQTYSSSKGLSARSVESFFKKALEWKEIMDVFGDVEADAVKSYGEVAKLLALPELKELRLIIRRPNPDDIDDTLAKEIEERLKEQRGNEYEEKLKSNGGDSLEPNKRTKRLADVAAENGQIITKSVINGVLVSQNTDDRPLLEIETYKSDESELSVFKRVSSAILGKISNQREPTND